MIIQLRDSFKSYCKGQDKVLPPQETIRRATLVLKKLSPPVLEKPKRFDKVDRIGIPITAFDFSTSQILKTYKLARPPAGKGEDHVQSQASALMELVERISASVFLHDESNFQLSSYRDIRWEKIAVKHLISSLPGNDIKGTLIETELKKVSMGWAHSYSLTRGKNILFPLEWFILLYGSNGFAAGNSFEEAIVQGLSEFIERYTISIITTRRLATPTIEINSINNRLAKELIARFNKAGIKLYVKDFSLGLAIPTIAVLAYDKKAYLEQMKIRCAAGTAINRDAALIRALLEVAQNRVFTLRDNQKKNWVFPNYKNLKEADYIVSKSKIISFSKVVTYSSNNFKNEIETTVKGLEKKGYEVIVTDIMHKILKIPAVIVTVVGLPAFLIPGALEDIDARELLIRRMIRTYENKKQYLHSIKILDAYFNLEPQERKKTALLYIYGMLNEKIKRFHVAINIFNEAVAYCRKSNQKRLSDVYKGLARCYLGEAAHKRLFKMYKKQKHILLQDNQRNVFKQ